MGRAAAGRTSPLVRSRNASVVRHVVLGAVLVGWGAAFVAGQGRGMGIPGVDVPQLSDEELRRMLPEAPGREVVKRICGSECHTVEPVVSHAGDRAYWDGIVYDMTLQGAQLSPAEQEDVLAYLSGQFPPKIDVNLAPARVLETQLDFSPAEAAAIVAHRAAHGPYESIEALREVPGVAPAKIEAASRRLLFDTR